MTLPGVPGSDAAGTPLSICLLAVHALQVSGAGISVMTAAGHRGSVCATDEIAARIEEMQFSLGNGPCVDAFHHGPVLIADLDDSAHVGRARWPVFTREAAAAGARALFAFPLEIGAIRVGAFDLYRDRPGGLTDAQVGVALTLADAAAGALLDELFPARAAVDSVAPSLSFHAEVHQATGMLSVQLDLSLEDAFVRLRAAAFAAERSVHDVARDVVSGALRFGHERDDND